ncbi:hypothetical protein AC1031_006058 [Aphanomyces cochlioides]|nr:hypothetical protein AC1031_006058 [Aphanomyces cochlioides]
MASTESSGELAKSKKNGSKVQSQRILWTNDSDGGGMNSMEVLVAWLSNEANYTRWKGGDKNCGLTKGALAKEIVSSMEQHGIYHRKPKDIIQKVSVRESTYRSTTDWLNNTGQGVEDEESIRAHVEKMCPHYYSLDSVMRDRASTQPLATSSDLCVSDNDSENSQEESKASKQAAKVAQAKLDEWAQFNEKSLQMKHLELKQRQEDRTQNLALEEQRLIIEKSREDRLAKLETKYEEAQLCLDAKREEIAMAMRIRRIETRKELERKGWSKEEIDHACPI